MIVMRKKEGNYTKTELLNFRYFMNQFATNFTHVFGCKMFTNIFHMICVGHVADYMSEWGNLYRYSQQGWESLNSLLKYIFFRRTNIGGGKGKGKGVRSRLKPIGRFLQRRVLWMSGIADRILDEYDKDKNFNLQDVFSEIYLNTQVHTDEDYNIDDIDIHV